MSEQSLEDRLKEYEPLFGAWHVRGRIGEGAIGQVFEIERVEDDMTYRAALKVITIPENEGDVKRVLTGGTTRDQLPDYYGDLARRISREFKYLSVLKGNSYIVNYEDHVVKEDREDLKWDILIKTELLTPLVDHAIEHPMTEYDVLQLGTDICRALRFCGQYNIVHRDIKPQNIFVSPSGSYKLGDFGIARVVEETQSELSRKGSYPYMAPEVFHAESYGKSADIYSLGVVMYQYLNYGRVPFMPVFPKPFSYDDEESAFTKRMSGKPVPKPAKGSAKLRSIVLRACVYNREERYGSADEMLDDLEELQAKYRRKDRKARKKSNAALAAAANVKKSELPAADVKKPKLPVADAKTEGLPDAEPNTKEIPTPEPAERLKKKRLTVITTLSMLVIAACAASYMFIPKEVTDIVGIDPETEIYYDGSLQPEYSVEPDWFKDETIEFTSGDEDIFTVSEDGSITAVSIGEADLEMKAKDYIETVHISVVPKVTGISGIDKSYALTTGDSLQLEPKLEPEEFAGEEISFSSADEGVAAVDGSGLVTAASAGETKITVSAGGTSARTTVTVSDPVVYSSTASKSKSKSKSKTSKKSSKSSGSSSGSFNSKDDEYF